MDTRFPDMYGVFNGFVFSLAAHYSVLALFYVRLFQRNGRYDRFFPCEDYVLTFLARAGSRYPKCLRPTDTKPAEWHLL